MVRKGLNESDTGTASFALMGVLIILLSLVAVAYISYIENLNYEERLRTDKVNALEDSVDKALESLKSKVHHIGIESAFHGNSGHELDNSSRLFERRLDKYLNRSEGWGRGGYSIHVQRDGTDISMKPQVAEIDVVLPTMENRGRFDKLATDVPGELGKGNRTFYYGIEGVISVTAKDDDNGLVLNRTEDIDMTVDIPYPFLRDRMENFGNELKGSEGQVARITRYILSTLAQYRTLMGYGMMSFENFDNSSSESTSDILTVEDVEMALNMAVLLEMAYQYRAYDHHALDAMVENTTVSGVVSLELLINTYIQNGRLDPGDLVALFYGYGYDNDTVSRDDAHELEIGAVISQALNSIADQFVVKYLEYFRVIGFANLILEGMFKLKDLTDKAAEIGRSVLDVLTFWDDDEVEINPKQVQTVKDWVEETFIAAGLMGTNIIRDLYLPYDTIDGERFEGYPRLPDDLGEVYRVSHKTKLIGDEHKLYRYSCGHGDLHHKREDTCSEMVEVEDSNGEMVEVRCGAEEVLAGYEYVVHTVDVEVRGGPIFYSPVDILQGDDDIWQEFYTESYSEKGHEEIEDIRSMLRQTIRTIVDTIAGQPAIEAIIARYNKIEIDVNDRKSLFHDIGDAVNDAVEDAFDYFRENPDILLDIVGDYFDGGDPRIEDLKGLLIEHYDDFYGSRYIDNTAEYTAESLLAKQGPYVHIETVETEVFQGSVAESADVSFPQMYEPDEEMIRNVLVNGGVLSKERVTSLKDSILPLVEDGLESIKEREVSEVDKEERHSHLDGLLVQALDSYHYNTTVRPVIRDERTRGGSPTSAMIYDIEPDPATIGQHTVRFRADISVNATYLEWVSDKDGHLSNQRDFNVSALFLSPGEHEITLRVTDEDGFIHEDMEYLFVNRAPTAVINEEVPSIVSQNESITFSESSYDQDGHITAYYWDLGDGHNSSEREPEHIYTIPDEYVVTLTVTDDKGGVDSTSMDILVDNRPKVVNIDPAEGSNWNTDQSITVSFSEEVDPESMEYSVSPSVDFSVMWSNNNTTAHLTPSGYYQRYTSYELEMIDVLDVDNGTSSSMEYAVSHRWKTRKYAELMGYYPSEENEVELQRSVVLSFDEPVWLKEDINDFVSGDHGWVHRFEDGNKRLVLDHDGFPAGELVELEFELSCLNSRFDDSIVTSDGRGDPSFSMSFVTEHREMPLLLSVSPKDGSVNVSVDTDIHFEFSRSMNRTSVNLTVFPPLDGEIYTWNEGNTTLTVEHNGFREDTLYSVQLIAKDLQGNHLLLTDEFPAHFRTEDRIPLTVVAISPDDGETRYLTQAPIVIVFSKSIEPESLEFSMDPDPGYWYQEWNDDRTRLNLNHDDFKGGAWYTFVLENAEDLSGNSLEEKVEITFMTSMNGDKIQGNLLERRLWSIIGGGLMEGSLFDLAEDILKQTTSNLILSGQMSNLEVRLPMAYSKPFEYGSHPGEGTKELDMIIRYDPGYIPLDDEDIISEPTGVHYTNLLSLSSTPYETSWDISIPETDLRLNISSESHSVMTGGEHKNLWINQSLALDFDIRITVFSGWGLAGVDYSITDDVFSAIKSFLDNVWDRLVDAFSYMIDGIRKLIDTMKNIVDTIKDYAADIVEFIGNMVRKAVQELIAPRVTSLIDDLDNGELKEMNRELSILGLRLKVHIQPDGADTRLPMYEGGVQRFINVSLGGSLSGTSYRLNVNILDDNLVLFGRLSMGSLKMNWQSDPLADPTGNTHSIYPAWFQAQGRSGTEGDGARLNLTIPRMKEPKEEFKLALSSVVPINTVTIPIGPIVVTGIDLGAKMAVRDVEEDGMSLIHGMIGNVFRDTADTMSSVSFSLDYIVEFIKSLLQRFVEELLSLIQTLIQELVLFFNVVISGVEVALSFGISCGNAVFSFFEWVGETVRELIVESISSRRLVSPGNTFPDEIIHATELGISIGQAGVNAYFDINLPALAALVGKDIGRWSIGFGVDVPEMKLVDGVLTEW